MTLHEDDELLENILRKDMKVFRSMKTTKKMAILIPLSSLKHLF